MGEDDNLKSVLGKCFAILDAVSASEELTMSEIAKATGVPKSTTSRLVKRLSEWGALENSFGRYRVGIRIFEMSRSVSSLKRLREISLPFIEDVYEATHEVVHLGILAGTDVMYIEKIVGHRSAEVPSTVGGRFPAHCTGLGKALLAYSDADMFRRVVEAGLKPRTPYTIVSPSVLAEELKHIRTTGIATEHEQALLGISCVASPVLTPDRRPIAALSISSPARRFRPEVLGPAVRTAALALSRALAHTGIRAVSVPEMAR
jgi:DNA-binding IclR family transcriptional regulator